MRKLAVVAAALAASKMKKCVLSAVSLVALSSAAHAASFAKNMQGTWGA